MVISRFLMIYSVKTIKNTSASTTATVLLFTAFTHAVIVQFFSTSHFSNLPKMSS